jgi:hypothetical protein
VIVELDEAGAAVQRISLLMHELAHHFYESAPAAKHARLIREFLAAPEEYSMGLYSYLSEAVATAVAIHVENQIRRPASFAEFVGTERQVNTNSVIAKAGISIFALVQKRLRQGRTIFDGFTPEYISAACKGLDQLCRSPSLELATRTVIFRDPAAREVAEEFPKYVHSIVTLSGWEPLQKYRQLSGAVFLMTAEVKWFLQEGKVLPSRARPAIRSAFGQNRAFVYGLRRAGKGEIYIFVADDRASLEETTQAFAKSNESFEGVRFAIKR